MAAARIQADAARDAMRIQADAARYQADAARYQADAARSQGYMTLLGTVLAVVIAAALIGFSLYRSACKLADKADPILALVSLMHEAFISTHKPGIPWLKARW